VKLKTLFLISLVAIVCLSFATFVQAPKPFRAFRMEVEPMLVEALPGELVTINGSIYNMGYFWIHDFNISVTGFPENYKVSVAPDYFSNVRTLREWSSEKGLYYVPERFFIVVEVPSDASGIYTVTATGQEFQSMKKVSNSTSFMFRVSAAPKVSITDINVPERVVEFEPFNISFAVSNEGASDQSVTLAMLVPEDWNVTPDFRAATIRPNFSETFEFTIIPTSTSGQISAVLKYPIKQTIMNITKAGPYLIPTMPSIIPIEIPTDLSAWLDGLVVFVQENTIVALVIVVAIGIVLWYFVSTYKFYSRRKKPEEIKKQIEISTPDIISTI